MPSLWEWELIILSPRGVQLKVRLQAPSATGTLRWHAKQIIQTHGIAGFYKAVFPTTVRAGILTSSQLGVYDHAKHTYVFFSRSEAQLRRPVTEG